MKRLIVITVFGSVVFLTTLAHAGEPFAHVTLDIASASATAWFGYPLQKGKRYRVVAICRPWGPDSSGVVSDEMLFQF